MPPSKGTPDVPSIQPRAYQILLALGDRTLHGYAIMSAVEERSGASISLLPGTLYNTLARMVDEGLVAEVDGPEYTIRGGKRKYYRVTPLGRAAALAETRRLEVLLRMAEQSGLREGGIR